MTFLVESVELALLSDIEMSSAIMMKDAYLPNSGEKTDEDRCAPCLQPEDSHKEDGSAGPNALVYVTKISTRTPPEEIEKILNKNPDRKTNTGTYDFYTIVLAISLHPGDPRTTRFINGTMNLAFLRGTKILTYSPKEKGIITAIIEKGGDAISLSQSLDFSSSASQGKKTQPDLDENRFEIPVGPDEKIAGTYSEKSGYSLNIPPGVLLDYRGMLKNEREMFWEIYPPMPGPDNEITGKERQVVFSLIVQTPKNSQPKITANIEGRVKGNLWGVVPIKGSVVF
jgi:hypothetical protein